MTPESLVREDAWLVETTRLIRSVLEATASAKGSFGSAEELRELIETETRRDWSQFTTEWGSVYYRLESPNGVIRRWKAVEKNFYPPAQLVVFIPDSTTIEKLLSHALGIQGQGPLSGYDARIAELFRTYNPVILGHDLKPITNKQGCNAESKLCLVGFLDDKRRIVHALPVARFPKENYYPAEAWIKDGNIQFHLGHKIIRLT